MTVEWWAWAAVIGFILAMLAVDLLFFHRDAHEVSIREAATWSAIWIALSLAFGAIVWAWLGGPAAGEYFSGYLIEKSLSVDNLFVFALLLGYFAVPLAYQHRLLYWGVIGALVARGVFIFAGVALLEAFHWTIYVFGALLVFTGVRMATHSDTEVHPEHNPMLNLLRRVVPITDEYVGQRLLHPPRRPPVGDAAARGARGDRDHRRRCSRSTRSRPCSRSPTTRSWCSPPTRSRSSACARSTFSSRASSDDSRT